MCGSHHVITIIIVAEERQKQKKDSTKEPLMKAHLSLRTSFSSKRESRPLIRYRQTDAVMEPFFCS